MAYHYGDALGANPITAEDDLAYLEARWGRIAEQARMLTVSGSLVSLGNRQRDALGLATAWRYDIGEHRIECLFVFHGNVDVFLETGRWTVLEDRPAKVHRLPMPVASLIDRYRRD